MPAKPARAVIAVRLSPAERADLTRAAKRAALPLTTYIRLVALRAALSGVRFSPVPEGK